MSTLLLPLPARFSALQRAENSSIFCQHRRCSFKRVVSVLFSEPKIPQCCTSPTVASSISVFQCSSASRKFLNATPSVVKYRATAGFSALQRAENSSIGTSEVRDRQRPRVSVLFSEPKIPQLLENKNVLKFRLRFSALQRAENSSMASRTLRRSLRCARFSALQRAENSSISRAGSRTF